MDSVTGYVSLACRLLIGGIFLVSAFSKVRGRSRYREFVSATATLTGLPVGWSGRLALLTVATETATVVLLVSPWTVAAGLVLAAATLLAFTYVLVRARRLRPGVPCRCFGPSATPVGVHHVVRNCLLIAVAAIGALAETWGGGPVEMGGAAIVLFVVLVCVLLITRLDDVAALLRPVRR